MGDLAIVYMVAGMSSRFGGKPKFFAEVAENETLIEYSLNQALPAGFTKIVFIVGEHTEKLFKEKFGNNYKGVPITYCLQTYNKEKRDKPWGTADALCCAEQLLHCPFIVCNGDDIYGEKAFKETARHLKEGNEGVTLGYKLGKVLSEKGGVNRGVFKITNGFVDSITETFGITKENMKSANLNEDSLVSMQLWGLTSNALNELKKKVEKFKEEYKDDRKAECLLPTELTNLIQEHKIKIKIYPTESRWFGLTFPEDEPILKKQLEELQKD